MTDRVTLGPKKILIVRMSNEYETIAIGLPAFRFFQQKFPEAEIHFLTYGQGETLLHLADKNLQLKVLAHWPDDFFQAMEAFLGLAEEIVGEAYTQIVNLDTAFMPCFLARFLQDAGEPISGNYLSISTQSLLDQVQDQSLHAEYVNVPVTYVQSSFFTMARWFSNWALGDHLPDGGYPEFYLKKCCGFSDLQMNNHVALEAELVKSSPKKVIALCLSQSDDGYLYPHGEALQSALENKGFSVWRDSKYKGELSDLLRQLNKSDLLVSKPSGIKWLADSVSCPSLLVSGAVDPKVFMPDFATDATLPCPVHSGQQLIQNKAFKPNCLCDDPWVLADNIESVLLNLESTPQHE